MTTTLSRDEPAVVESGKPLGFVPALDGLRAVAVMIVIAYHGGWFGIHGGFIGVDVFFVLSGFLITRLMLDEHARHGSLSLRSFYIRRALRLLPALFGLVGGVWLAAAVLDVPTIESNLGSRSFWALSYVANWHDVITGTHGGPFSHLWSLSVEEQFYVVWPLAVVAVLRRYGSRGVRLTAAGLCALASLTTIIRFWAGASAFDIYFATHSHGMILLLAGSCLGASPEALNGLSRDVGRKLTVIGLIGIGLISLSPDRFSPLHAGAGYLPVGIVSLAVVAGVVADGRRSPLTWGPLRRIGAASYGLYLWHIPMFAISTAIAPTVDPRLRIMIGTVVATVLSHYLIERPALRYKDRWLRS